MNEVRWIGLEGTCAALPLREAWALSADEQARVHAYARAAGWGLLLLSTCHRVEVYVEAPERADVSGTVRAWLRALRPDLDLHLFAERTGADVLHHLFRVAAGLDSAILGEAQILGQLRRAREAAQTARTLTPLLREAVRAAVAAGRAVRAETSLGHGAASTASAALHLAVQTVGSLRGRAIVVVGAGEVGRLLLKHLPDVGAARVDVVTRTIPRPAPTAYASFHTPDALPALLATADVVFTGTTRRVLTAALVQATRPTSPARPLTIIDLGVPRNVEAAVGTLPGVTLRDVDALQAVVEASLARRQSAVPAAEQVIDVHLQAFEATAHRLQREQTVRAMRRRTERIRRETLAYVCSRCTNRTCNPAPSGAAGRCSDPDLLTRTLTDRLFHDVTRALRHGTADVDDAALRTLFRLPEDPHA